MKILAGGRRAGRDVSEEQTFPFVEVGKEYVVLGFWCRPEAGLEYLILREDIYPGGTPVLITAEMFEIVSAKLPTSWVACDLYGDGITISVGPEAWARSPNFFEQKLNGDVTLIPVYVQEVERMYAEEGVDPPRSS